MASFSTMEKLMFGGALVLGLLFVVAPIALVIHMMIGGEVKGALNPNWEPG